MVPGWGLSWLFLRFRKLLRRSVDAARGMAALASSWDAGDGEVDCMHSFVKLEVKLATLKHLSLGQHACSGASGCKLEAESWVLRISRLEVQSERRCMQGGLCQ